jgi:quinol monooxygenase YgiN
LVIPGSQSSSACKRARQRIQGAQNFTRWRGRRNCFARRINMSIVVVARIKAKAGSEQKLEEAFRSMIGKVRAEPGCEQYILHRALKDPTQFVFFEVYKDKEALDFHGKTPHMAELGKSMRELIESTTLDILSEVDRK